MFGLHHTLFKWISSFLSDRPIAIRVDGYLSNPHSINSGVPQGSVNSPVLFILFINGLLSPTSSSIFSFDDDTSLSSSFSSYPQHRAYSNISPYRNTSASLLTDDLTNVEKWGSDNLVKFNEGKAKQVVISRKHHQDFPPVFMNGHKLDISSSITQLGLSISSNLTWKPHIHCIAMHASQKLGFLSRARGYFSPSQLLTIYNPRFVLLWSTAPMSRVVLLNLLSIFLTESSLKLFVSSIIQTSLILYSLSLPLSSCSRSFHFLPLFSRTLLSGNQEYFS